MAATLERRIARLEAAPPPPDDPGEGPAPWWWGIPEPLRRYFREVDAELAASPDWPGDPDAALASLWAQHHWLPSLLGLLSAYFAPDGHTWTPGRLPTLRGVQRDLLNHGQTRLQRLVREEHGGAVPPAAINDEAWRRHMGVDHARGTAIWFSREPEIWVRQWRVSGSTNAADLVAMGLHEAELALLSADDEAP